MSTYNDAERDRAPALPPGPYEDSASQYLKAGWSPISLPEGKKFKPLSGFTGHKGRYVETLADVEEQAAGHPNGNVALRMPDGVIGIDVDAYKPKVGGQTLAQAEGRLGALPATWRSSSRNAPSGIWFYRVPEERTWKDVGLHVETISWHHRYAVVWPSVNPNDGGSRYRWTDPDGLPCQVPAVEDLPWLPAAWVRELDKGEGVQGSPEMPVELSPHTVRTKVEETLRWLEDAPDGARNDSLNKAARTVGGLWARLDFDCDDEDLNESELKGWLEEVAWSLGLTKSETHTTLRSGWDSGVADPMGATKVARLAEDEFGVVEAVEDDEPAPVRAEFEVLDLAALLDPDRPPRRWLWDGMVPWGDQASVVAPGGTGKSLLVLGLCLAAVSGRGEFVGRALDFEGRVFYVDMENSEDDWAERLRAYGWTRDNVGRLAGRFLPLSLPPLGGLDTKVGSAQLKAFLTAHGVREGDLLVLDSMQRVTEGEENDNDTLRNLYNHTSAWLKARKVTVIRTDNTGKDEDKGARGASAKRDDVGYSFLLQPVGSRRDGRFRLRSTKHRGAGDGGEFVFERTHDEGGHLCWRPVSTQASAADLDFEMPRHMADTLFVLHLLTDSRGPNHEDDLIAMERLLGFVPGKAENKRNGVLLLTEEGYLHKDHVLLANGQPGKRVGFRLTEQGREWVADQQQLLAERQAELATRIRP